MKKTLTLSMCIIGMLSTYAQISSRHNMMRPTDEIIKQQVEYKDPGRAGESVIWNFSKLKGVNPEYRLRYSSPVLVNDSIYIMGQDTILANEVKEGDLVIGTEHYTRYYYRLKNDTLLNLGHENPVTLMHHTTPLVLMIFPFDYMQSFQNNFDTKGLYSSKKSVKTFGNIETKCDAYGKMILPSGDTLNNVVRIKTTQIINDTSGIHINNENNQLHNVENLFLKKKISKEKNTNQDTTSKYHRKLEAVTYSWYTKGYRYPIFETIQTFEIRDSLKNEIFTTAYFYPPQDHYYLADDPENLAVIDSLWNEKHKNPTDPTNPNGNMSQSDGFNYNFYPNPVKDKLYIEYMLEEDAKISIALYDMEGKLIFSLPERNIQYGLYNETIDCHALAQGNYILRFSVNNQVINEKILKK